MLPPFQGFSSSAPLGAAPKAAVGAVLTVRGADGRAPTLTAARARHLKRRARRRRARRRALGRRALARARARRERREAARRARGDVRAGARRREQPRAGDDSERGRRARGARAPPRPRRRSTRLDGAAEAAPAIDARLDGADALGDGAPARCLRELVMLRAEAAATVDRALLPSTVALSLREASTAREADARASCRRPRRSARARARARRAPRAGRAARADAPGAEDAAVAIDIVRRDERASRPRRRRPRRRAGRLAQHSPITVLVDPDRESAERCDCRAALAPPDADARLALRARAHARAPALRVRERVPRARRRPVRGPRRADDRERRARGRVRRRAPRGRVVGDRDAHRAGRAARRRGDERIAEGGARRRADRRRARGARRHVPRRARDERELARDLRAGRGQGAAAAGARGLGRRLGARARARARFRLGGGTTGILLFGPSGCSKTTLVRTIARAAGATLIALAGADVYSAYVGDAEAHVRDARARARADAAERALLRRDRRHRAGALGRGRRRRRGERARHVPQLPRRRRRRRRRRRKRRRARRRRATNRPHVLDDALLRPGRFGVAICVLEPNRAERGRILRHYSAELPLAMRDVEPRANARRPHRRRERRRSLGRCAAQARCSRCAATCTPRPSARATSRRRSARSIGARRLTPRSRALTTARPPPGVTVSRLYDWFGVQPKVHVDLAACALPPTPQQHRRRRAAAEREHDGRADEQPRPPIERRSRGSPRACASTRSCGIGFGVGVVGAGDGRGAAPVYDGAGVGAGVGACVGAGMGVGAGVGGVRIAPTRHAELVGGQRAVVAVAPDERDGEVVLVVVHHVQIVDLVVCSGKGERADRSSSGIAGDASDELPPRTGAARRDRLVRHGEHRVVVRLLVAARLVRRVGLRIAHAARARPT